MKQKVTSSFPVRAQARVMGSVPGQSVYKRQLVNCFFLTLVFLSLSFSLPYLHSKNKQTKIFKTSFKKIKQKTRGYWCPSHIPFTIPSTHLSSAVLINKGPLLMRPLPPRALVKQELSSAPRDLYQYLTTGTRSWFIAPRRSTL